MSVPGVAVPGLAVPAGIPVGPAGMPPLSGTVGPIYVGTTDQLNEGDGGVCDPLQRGAFTGYGLSWLFYADNQDFGGDLKYVTSTDDGNTWSGPTSTGIGASGRGSDVHFDGTYVHVVTAGSPTTYTRGTPATDGSIAWDAQQTVPISAGQDHTWEPSIVTDSAGYPWIVFEEWDAAVHARVTVTGSSTKDGTWTTRAGHPHVLSDASTGPGVTLCWTHLDRLNDALGLIAFYWYEAEVYANVWDGASWGAYEGPLDSPLHDNHEWDLAFAADSQAGTACFAWSDGSSGTYATVRDATGAWGAPTQIGSDQYRSLAMSVDGDGQWQLFGVVAWNTGSVDQITGSPDGGSWGIQPAVADVSGSGEEIRPFGLQVVPIAFEGRLLVHFQSGYFGGGVDNIYAYLTPATPATWADGAGSGGSALTATINDALGLADSMARVATFARTIADPLALADAQAAAATWARAVADALAVADSIAAAASYARTVADPLAVADSLAAVSAYTRLVGDLLDLADTTTRTAAYQRSIDELLGIADTTSTSGSNAYVQQIDDTLDLADGAAAVLALQRSIVDPLGLADSIALQAAVARVVADQLDLADAAARIATYQRALADPLGLVDAMDETLLSGTPWAELIEDVLGLADSVGDAGGYSRQVDDALGLADAAAQTSTLRRTIADPLALDDDLDRLADFRRSTADVLLVADQTTRLVALRRAIDDQLGFVDFALIQFAPGGVVIILAVRLSARALARVHTDAHAVAAVHIEASRESR